MFKLLPALPKLLLMLGTTMLSNLSLPMLPLLLFESRWLIALHNAALSNLPLMLPLLPLPLVLHAIGLSVLHVSVLSILPLLFLPLLNLPFVLHAAGLSKLFRLLHAVGYAAGCSRC